MIEFDDQRTENGFKGIHENKKYLSVLNDYKTQTHLSDKFYETCYT